MSVVLFQISSCHISAFDSGNFSPINSETILPGFHEIFCCFMYFQCRFLPVSPLFGSVFTNFSFQFPANYDFEIPKTIWKIRTSESKYGSLVLETSMEFELMCRICEWLEICYYFYVFHLGVAVASYF